MRRAHQRLHRRRLALGAGLRLHGEEVGRVLDGGAQPVRQRLLLVLVPMDGEAGALAQRVSEQSRRVLVRADAAQQLCVLLAQSPGSQAAALDGLGDGPDQPGELRLVLRVLGGDRGEGVRLVRVAPGVQQRQELVEVDSLAGCQGVIVIGEVEEAAEVLLSAALGGGRLLDLSDGLVVLPKLDDEVGRGEEAVAERHHRAGAHPHRRLGPADGGGDEVEPGFGNID